MLLEFVAYGMTAFASSPSWGPVDQQHVLPSDRAIAQFASIGNSNIVAVAKNEIFRSDDSGMTWYVISPPNQIPADEVLAAVSGPIGPKRDLYAGGSGGLYKLELPGSPGTWQWSQVMYPGVSVTAIAQYAYVSNEFLTGVTVGLLGIPPVNSITATSPAIEYSSDGTSWSGIDDYPTLAASGTSYPTCIVIQGKHLIVGSTKLGIYTSDNSGSNYSFAGLKEHTCSSVAIIQNPADGWYHYAATEVGLFRSPFFTPKFVRIGPPETQSANMPATVIAIGQLLLIAFPSYGVAYSTSCGDDGSWQTLNDGFPVNFNLVNSFGVVGNYLLASVSTPNGLSTLRIDLSTILGASPTPAPIPVVTPAPPTGLRVITKHTDRGWIMQP